MGILKHNVNYNDVKYLIHLYLRVSMLCALGKRITINERLFDLTMFERVSFVRRLYVFSKLELMFKHKPFVWSSPMCNTKVYVRLKIFDTNMCTVYIDRQLTKTSLLPGVTKERKEIRHTTRKSSPRTMPASPAIKIHCTIWPIYKKMYVYIYIM